MSSLEFEYRILIAQLNVIAKKLRDIPREQEELKKSQITGVNVAKETIRLINSTYNFFNNRSDLIKRNSQFSVEKTLANKLKKTTSETLGEILIFVEKYDIVITSELSRILEVLARFAN